MKMIIMKKVSKIFLVLSCCVLTFGSLSFSQTEKTLTKDIKSPIKNGKLTWIVRSDGSKSCDAEDSGEALEVGAKLLRENGIRVVESKKIFDQKMHIMMCGAETGRLNAYRIAKSDLPVALGIEGFKKVSPPPR